MSFFRHFISHGKRQHTLFTAIYIIFHAIVFKWNHIICWKDKCRMSLNDFELTTTKTLTDFFYSSGSCSTLNLLLLYKKNMTWWSDIGFHESFTLCTLLNSAYWITFEETSNAENDPRKTIFIISVDDTTDNGPDTISRCRFDTCLCISLYLPSKRYQRYALVSLCTGARTLYKLFMQI